MMKSVDYKNLKMIFNNIYSENDGMEKDISRKW